jgi:peptidoglycan/LPS O-acetylase OafA/YrhL
MGIAIIWICFFHAKVNFPDSVLFYPLFFLKEAGYGGVDIFLFLSGFGLMYGMQNKKYSLTTFYKKRVLRILPTYWLVFFIVIVAEIISGRSIFPSRILLVFSTAGFWINKHRFDWFIPSLLALYFLFPPFFSILRRSQDKKKFIVIICIIALSCCLFIMPTKANYLLIFFARIPIFFIGAYIGHISFTSVSLISPKQLLFYMFCLFFGVGSCLYVINKFSVEQTMPYGLRCYPFIICTLPICLFLSLAMEKINNSSVCNIKHLIQWLFFFCGSYSLEIYLIHSKIFFFNAPVQ